MSALPDKVKTPNETDAPPKENAQPNADNPTKTEATMSTQKADNASKTKDHKVTKTIVTSPDVYKPVGPYRFVSI